MRDIPATPAQIKDGDYLVLLPAKKSVAVRAAYNVARPYLREGALVAFFLGPIAITSIFAPAYLFHALAASVAMIFGAPLARLAYQDACKFWNKLRLQYLEEVFYLEGDE